jgi:protein-S-isoprenylcysteine O-methyltransferase Ste14
MRAWPIVVDVVVMLAALAGTRAQVRRARGGERPSPASLVALAVLLLLSVLGLGTAIGYALRGTAMAAFIGCGVAGVLILIVGPLVRIWASGRLAQKQQSA